MQLHSASTVLLVLAFACFVADSFGMWHQSPRRPNLTALGLALWVLSLLVGAYLR